MYRSALAVSILCVAMLDAGWTLAGSSGRVVTPLPRVKARSGLRLSVETNWVTGSGYRPVTIRISPINGIPAVAERYIDVMVRPRGWSGGEKAGAVTATVHLPEGALVGEAQVNIPQTNSWMMMELEAYEGGKFLRDLSVKRAALGARHYYDSSDGTPAILFIHPMALNMTAIGQGPVSPFFSLVVEPTPVAAAGGLSIQPLLRLKAMPVNQQGMGKELSLLPDIRILAGRFPMSYYNGYITADRFIAKNPTTDAETLRLVADLPFMMMCSPQTLPDEWLGLTSLDIIFASLEDLQVIAIESPEKWEAIRAWLSTGTLLCVHGVGADFQRLSQLEELLELPPDGAAQQEQGGWKNPPPSGYREDIKALESTPGANWWQQQANIQRKAADPGDRGATMNPIAPAKAPFKYREVGQGQVVAIALDKPFPGTEHDWSWLFNSIPPQKWLWYQRHGLSTQRQNKQYWNFLIADIGRAPVMSFITLISLFAIVIGPVNYYLLHQRSRLYMLLVTVPAGALLVTFGLFTYAALADGLGTRAQVRSYTEIDHRTGRAVSWSRHMYYAGLAPSRGLVFPADAAVYPIDYEPVNPMGLADTSRHLVWGEEQNFVAGYFISRTPSQLLVVEPRRTSSGLQVESSGKEGSPRVTNKLGSLATRILVCDAVGDLWTASDLADGASATLKKTTMEVETEYWTRIRNENRLKFPEGFNPANLENVSGIFGGVYRAGGNLEPAVVETSVLETGIADALSLKSMQPNTYLVLTGRPSNVSLGVEAADERSGFHLVQGKW